METIIVVILLTAIAAGIIWYLLRQKKRGAKCVGCPYARQCSSCSGSCANKKTVNNTQ